VPGVKRITQVNTVKCRWSMKDGPEVDVAFFSVYNGRTGVVSNQRELIAKDEVEILLPR